MNTMTMRNPVETFVNNIGQALNKTSWNLCGWGREGALDDTKPTLRESERKSLMNSNNNGGEELNSIYGFGRKEVSPWIKERIDKVVNDCFIDLKIAQLEKEVEYEDKNPPNIPVACLDFPIPKYVVLARAIDYDYECEETESTYEFYIYNTETLTTVFVYDNNDQFLPYEGVLIYLPEEYNTREEMLFRFRHEYELLYNRYNR